jgi:hypothetical protein
VRQQETKNIYSFSHTNSARLLISYEYEMIILLSMYVFILVSLSLFENYYQ